MTGRSDLIFFCLFFIGMAYYKSKSVEKLDAKFWIEILVISLLSLVIMKLFEFLLQKIFRR